MTEISISICNIDLFKEIDCNVTIIKWEVNKLVKEILELFPNVAKLYCIDNGTTSLKPLCNCNLTLLTLLYLAYN